MTDATVTVRATHLLGTPLCSVLDVDGCCTDPWVQFTAEIHSLSGLNDEEGRQLRITVASLRQQLGFERQQRARTSKEIAELRSHSSSSSRAGQALQQQVCQSSPGIIVRRIAGLRLLF